MYEKGLDNDGGGNGKPETSKMYDAPVAKLEKQKNDQGVEVINYKESKDKTSTRTSLITDEVRVIKGGSWKDRAYWLDPAQRRYLPQYIATDYIGFRCAMTRLGSKSKKRNPLDIKEEVNLNFKLFLHHENR